MITEFSLHSVALRYYILAAKLIIRWHPMKVTFVEVDRETLFLLPPSIQDWLPEKHLARVPGTLYLIVLLRGIRSRFCLAQRACGRAA